MMAMMTNAQVLQVDRFLYAVFLSDADTGMCLCECVCILIWP